MDVAFVTDWLNLLLRWSHLIVGIAWIGASFYFIWLDNHLKPPIDPADSARITVTDSAEEAVRLVTDVGLRQFGLTYGPRLKRRWLMGE